jgi:hypothetical protein
MYSREEIDAIVRCAADDQDAALTPPFRPEAAPGRSAGIVSVQTLAPATSVLDLFANGAAAAISSSVVSLSAWTRTAYAISSRSSGLSGRRHS